MTMPRTLILAALAAGMLTGPAGADDGRFRLAQGIRPNAPASPTPAPAAPPPSSPSAPSAEPPAGGLITKFTPQIALQMAQDAGLSKPEITVNDDKSTSVFGQYGSVWIELSLGECTATCDDEVTIYGDFGQRVGTDVNFTNAFNNQGTATLYIDGDGDLILSLVYVAEGGVTRQNAAAVLRRFLGEIDSASTFKPK